MPYYLIASSIDTNVLQTPLTRSQGLDTVTSAAGSRLRPCMQLRDVMLSRQLLIDAGMASDWRYPMF
jgi:hypothetical protein